MTNRNGAGGSQGGLALPELRTLGDGYRISPAEVRAWKDSSPQPEVSGLDVYAGLELPMGALAGMLLLLVSMLVEVLAGRLVGWLRVQWLRRRAGAGVAGWALLGLGLGCGWSAKAAVTAQVQFFNVSGGAAAADTMEATTATPSPQAGNATGIAAGGNQACANLDSVASGTVVYGRTRSSASVAYGGWVALGAVSSGSPCVPLYWNGTDAPVVPGGGVTIVTCRVSLAVANLTGAAQTYSLLTNGVSAGSQVVASGATFNVAYEGVQVSLSVVDGTGRVVGGVPAGGAGWDCKNQEGFYTFAIPNTVSFADTGGSASAGVSGGGTNSGYTTRSAGTNAAQDQTVRDSTGILANGQAAGNNLLATGNRTLVGMSNLLAQTATNNGVWTRGDIGNVTNGLNRVGTGIDNLPGSLHGDATNRLGALGLMSASWGLDLSNQFVGRGLAIGQAATNGLQWGTTNYSQTVTSLSVFMAVPGMEGGGVSIDLHPLHQARWGFWPCVVDVLKWAIALGTLHYAFKLIYEGLRDAMLVPQVQGAKQSFGGFNLSLPTALLYVSVITGVILFYAGAFTTILIGYAEFGGAGFISGTLQSCPPLAQGWSLLSEIFPMDFALASAATVWLVLVTRTSIFAVVSVIVKGMVS